MLNVWLQAAFVAAFVMLVAGVLLWLRSAERRLARLADSVEAMELQAQRAAAQLTVLLTSSTEAVKSAQRHLDGASRLFESIGAIGETAERASASFSRLVGGMTEATERYMSRAGGKYRRQIAEAADWAEVGYAAWQFWQAKRKESRAAECFGYNEGHDNND